MSSEGIPQTRVGVGVLVFRTLSNAGAGVDHHIEGTREKGTGTVSHFGAVEVLISKRWVIIEIDWMTFSCGLQLCSFTPELPTERHSVYV